MILPMGRQGLLFLFICLLGFCFGLLYDVIRLFRRAVKARFVLGALWDGLFWLFAAVTVFYLLLGINYGEVRIYTVLGFIGGMVVYYNGLSPVFMLGAEKLLRRLKRLFIAVLRPIWGVFILPLGLIKFKLKKHLFCGIIKLRIFVKKLSFPFGRRIKWKKAKTKKQRKKKKSI